MVTPINTSEQSPRIDQDTSFYEDPHPLQPTASTNPDSSLDNIPDPLPREIEDQKLTISKPEKPND